MKMSHKSSDEMESFVEYLKDTYGEQLEQIGKCIGEMIEENDLCHHSLSDLLVPMYDILMEAVVKNISNERNDIFQAAIMIETISDITGVNYDNIDNLSDNHIH